MSLHRVAGLLLIVSLAAELALADVTLVENGQPRAALFVPARLLDDAKANPEPANVQGAIKPEDERRRLRESVRDFVGIVERMSGTKLEIVYGAPPAGESRVPILVGELAVERFGKPAKSFPYQQGLRIVVARGAVGLAGESDLATSYALYTLLDQLGCRWFMPSALGEVLPSLSTVRLAEQDVSTGPTTSYRGLWYQDNDYVRRNRLGGRLISAGHALEMTVPKELRKSHPEIRAIVEGKPHDHRVKWTHPLVAQSIAEASLRALERDPAQYTFSLSPDDGLGWDESDDTKFDAGDFDAAAGAVSKTDRLMVLANRVAEAVAPKHPHVRFGILAYADYIRPPKREKVHAAVVPQIAPITFSRAHPMNDDGEPNNRDLRYLVEGWGRAVAATSYYFYGFNLAEVASPNPMIAKWSHDIPFIYERGRCEYWQPETISNFDTSLHALYLGLRLAWDKKQPAAAVIDDLHARFYGAAASEMAAYWHGIDDCWTKTPEYSGCGFGHLRRFPLERLSEARGRLTRAAAACRTDAERARVALAEASFASFEQFLKLRRDLADGRWEKLDEEAEAYRRRMIELGDRYQPQFAFTKMGWTQNRTLGVIYFDAFYKATYDDAARLARMTERLAGPLRQWRVRRDAEKAGEAAGWSRADFDDSAWRTTDCAVETWSTLGWHNDMGAAWYRTSVTLPEVTAGKKVWLWLGATDGRVKVFVNGKHVPYVPAKGPAADSFTGYCQPASWDITPAVRRGENRVALLATREFLNELGTGGLIAPAAVLREK